MTTGERIKKLRLEKQWSQEELGKRLGVQRAAVNKYETGAVVNLKRSTIAKLAEVFGVSPLFIMGIEETPSGEPEITEGEQMLIELFRQVPEERQPMVLEMIRAALKNL